MTDLIEKLGIKPINQFECIGTNGIRRNAVCNASEVRELEQQRNEMLEALIKSVESEIEYEASGDAGSWNVFENEPTKTSIAVIQKATGKSWKEIKELIDE